MAGGFDGTSLLTSVEVYSPEGTCNFVLEPLPEATYGLSLHFMSGNLYACGGHRKGKKCYRHVATESIGWIEDSNLKLNSPRFMAAQAVSQNGVVILRLVEIFLLWSQYIMIFIVEVGIVLRPSNTSINLERTGITWMA